MNKIKVLIIDDSKTMQEWLGSILGNDPEIEVVGKAGDPYIARDLIKEKNPNVLTLDIIMPKMDGITFLKNLMRLHPLPVIMISSLTETGSVVALEAMANGAVDYFPKPTQQEYENIDTYSKALITAIKNASQTRVGKISKPTLASRALEHIIYHSDFLRNTIIGIGGSTGGIEAIESILANLPKTFPSILIAQHIRQEFTGAFAKRINKLFRLNIKEAEQQEEIIPGSVYIAPGGVHLCIRQMNKRFYCVLEDSPPVQGHRPSIDVLFKSIAEVVGANSIGILLTGMGSDGAEGAQAIQKTGGKIIVQDKESSVVWGIPGAAVKLNAVDAIAPLSEIPQVLFETMDSMARKQQSI